MCGWVFPHETFQEVNLLGEGAEGVAEGLGCQVEKSLQEHVDLQGVEALALVCNVYFFRGLKGRRTETDSSFEKRWETNRRRLPGWGSALLSGR